MCVSREIRLIARDILPALESVVGKINHHVWWDLHVSNWMIIQRVEDSVITDVRNIRGIIPMAPDRYDFSFDVEPPFKATSVRHLLIDRMRNWIRPVIVECYIEGASITQIEGRSDRIKEVNRVRSRVETDVNEFY